MRVGSIVVRPFGVAIWIGRRNEAVMRCRAGSEVSPPTRTPETVTPCEIRCAGVDAGAAAHASPALTNRAASVLSTGREFKHLQGFSASAPSDAVRTVMNPMASGTWQLEQCAHADVRALAEALGISETTASVLARRGYRDAEEAQRFVEGKLPGSRSTPARRHGRGGRGDPCRRRG